MKRRSEKTKPLKAPLEHTKPLKDALRDWRIANNVSQEQAAAHFKIPLRTWQNWEQGRNPRFSEAFLTILRTIQSS